MAVNNLIKRIQNIMRSDAGISGDAQRIEQMVWMFFLKVYDSQEDEWEYKAYQNKREYKSIIPEELRWRNWAVDNADGNALTGDGLLEFINTVLFPVFKGNTVTYNGKEITKKYIKYQKQNTISEKAIIQCFKNINNDRAKKLIISIITILIILLIKQILIRRLF